MRWIAASLSLFMLLGGCGPAAETSVTLEFWALGREGEVVQQLLPEFERRNPDVRVRAQQLPWSAAHEKLLTAYAGDAMPDVFQLGNTWIPEFVALRAVEPLDGRLTGSGATALADFFPGVLTPNVIDGATYALPWYVDTRLLFYRTDLLAAAGYAEPPRAWDAWLDAMQRIRDQSAGAGYAILLPLDDWTTPVILALQLGAGLLRDGDRYGDFQNPAFRRAFDFYLELFRRRLAPTAGEAQVGNVYREFAAGYFALYISGPWNIGEFDRRLPPAVKDRWSTAPMPAPGAIHPGVSLAGGASLAICRYSAHKEAAWKLLQFLTEPARQVEFYRLTGDLPSRQSAWRLADLANRPPTQAFWEQLQAVQATPRIPEWERIAARIARYAEEAARGRLSPEEALAALDRDADLILEKRRWLLRQKR